MEYRRFPNRVPERKVGLETLLAPQLEDYEVFRAGICHPDQLLEPFQLVLNVVCVSPRELELSFPEDKILKVDVRHCARRFKDLMFARYCSISFVLPDDVDKNKLVAKWYDDDFLVINQKKDEKEKEKSAPVVPGGRTRDSPDTGAEPENSTDSSGQRQDDGGIVESGSMDPSSVPLGTEDSDLQSDANRLEDVKVLKPLFENLRFKPFVDVDAIQNLFAEIADKASLEEKYMQSFFFTTANFEMKRKQSSELITSMEETIPHLQPNTDPY